MLFVWELKIQNTTLKLNLFTDIERVLGERVALSIGALWKQNHGRAGQGTSPSSVLL